MHQGSGKFKLSAAGNGFAGQISTRETLQGGFSRATEIRCFIEKVTFLRFILKVQ